jgi:hypothetical protein
VPGDVVRGFVEQQAAERDHAFQDADGVDDRCDRNPGDVSLHSRRVMVSALVSGVLERLPADQVPPGLAVVV